jgi:hypothetical protein
LLGRVAWPGSVIADPADVIAAIFHDMGTVAPRIHCIEANFPIHGKSFFITTVSLLRKTPQLPQQKRNITGLFT